MQCSQGPWTNTGHQWLTALKGFEIFLWWWILYVSLTEFRDTYIAGKLSFLSVSLRMFPGNISIGLSRLKKIALISMCGHYPIYWKSEENKRAEEKWIHSLSRDIHLLPWEINSPVSQACTPTRFYDIGSLSVEAFGFGPKLYPWVSWAYSSQMADCETSQPS